MGYSIHTGVYASAWMIPGRFFMFPVKKTFNGFTLVELLVVIAVISIMAALLLPAIRSVNQKANLVICISNQKQVYVAMIMEAEEMRSGRFKYAHDTSTGGACGLYNFYTNQHEGMIHRLYKSYNATKTNYLDDYKVFGCPEFWSDSKLYETRDHWKASGWVKWKYQILITSQSLWDKLKMA